MEQHGVMLERMVRNIMRYHKEFALAVALVATVLGSFGLYYWYKNHTARQAHKAYVQALSLQNARIVDTKDHAGTFETVFSSEEDKWNAVEKAFAGVYERYNNSGIGVMAGAARAHALIKLNRDDEAKKLFSEISSRTPSAGLRALYTLTYARMQLDSSDESDVKAGLKLLEQLAATKDNPMHDTALYYLGEHYWFSGDMNLAKNYWNQLVVTYGDMDKNSSPWLMQTKEKLGMIAGE
jgi:hypothetical protein